MSKTIDVKKIAALARLDLNEDEEKDLKNNFENILDYFEIIDKVETSSTSISSKNSELRQTFRADKMIPNSITPEDFSPFTENHFFKVPKVID